MIYRYLFIAFFSFLICGNIDAQLVDEEQIREQLANEGIDENEVRKRLVARGFDIENIDPNDPDALAAIQKATEEIIEELDRRLKEFLGEIDETWEVLFINDGSKDHTLEMLSERKRELRAAPMLQNRRKPVSTAENVNGNGCCF